MCKEKQQEGIKKMIITNQPIFHNMVASYRVQAVSASKDHADSNGGNSQQNAYKSQQIEDTAEVSNMARILFEAENGGTGDLVASIREYALNAQAKESYAKMVQSETTDNLLAPSGKGEESITGINNIVLSKLQAWTRMFLLPSFLPQQAFLPLPHRILHRTVLPGVPARRLPPERRTDPRTMDYGGVHPPGHHCHPPLGLLPQTFP